MASSSFSESSVSLFRHESHLAPVPDRSPPRSPVADPPPHWDAEEFDFKVHSSKSAFGVSSTGMSLTEGVDLRVLFGEDIPPSVDDLFPFEVDETSEEETVELDVSFEEDVLGALSSVTPIVT